MSDQREKDKERSCESGGGNAAGKKRKGMEEKRNMEEKARKIEKCEGGKRGQGAREGRVEMWEREPESVP